MIQSLEDEQDYSTNESDDDDRTDDYYLTIIIENTGLTNGSEYFRKEFEVRPGMENEAKAHKKEWKESGRSSRWKKCND